MPLDETEKMSQWSLTFEVRKSHTDSASAGYSAWSQWSLTFEVRKSRGCGRDVGIGGGSQWSLTFEVRERMSGLPSTMGYSIRRNGA